MKRKKQREREKEECPSEGAFCFAVELTDRSLARKLSGTRGRRPFRRSSTWSDGNDRLRNRLRFSTHLEIRPIILGDVWTVALRQHHYLLLNVLDLIFRLFEIDDLDGHNLLGPVVDTLEDLAEATLPNSLLFRKYQLGIHLLQQKSDGSSVSWSFER